MHLPGEATSWHESIMGSSGGLYDGHITFIYAYQCVLHRSSPLDIDYVASFLHIALRNSV